MINPEPILFFTIPVPPSLNRRFKPNKHRTFALNEAVHAYKSTVAILAIPHHFTPLDGKLFAQVTIYRPSDRGDADNYEKALWDSLQGILYHNDKQIKRHILTLEVDKQNPRLEIAVTHFHPDLYRLP